MRPPYYFQPQAMMNQMPVAPRFPMYAPYMMRGPAAGIGPVPGAGPIPGAGQFMNHMPIPPQAPIPGAGAGVYRNLKDFYQEQTLYLIMPKSSRLIFSRQHQCLKICPLYGVYTKDLKTHRTRSNLLLFRCRNNRSDQENE